jgi:hypothetical protein
LPVDARHQGAVFATYLVAAVLAGWLATHDPGLLVLLPLGAVLGALSLEFRRSPATG